jgi:hypothetical protein
MHLLSRPHVPMLSTEQRAVHGLLLLLLLLL